MIPSLSDLMLLWLNENYPRAGWHVGPTGLVYNGNGRLFGCVFDVNASYRWVVPDNPSQVELLWAADPEFFEKVRESIEIAMASKATSLHYIAPAS